MRHHVSQLLGKVSPSEAVELQRSFSKRVSTKTSFRIPPRAIAGADAAYHLGQTFAAAVVVNERMEIIEKATVTARTSFPYVPGLLAFREAPAVVRALRKLKRGWDVCLLDGHGIAHPRRFGFASHVGLALGLPTIGVAKSRLYGRESEEWLFDERGKRIGAILQISESRRRFYVSVGYEVSLFDAIRVARLCLTKRGVEPIVYAHEEVTKMRRRKWKRNS